MIETIGHYKILEPLGDDGFGTSYRARDTRAGPTVTVTTLDPRMPPDRRARILDAARAAAAVSHPGLATLYEVGEEQGVPFLVFEFVTGGSIRTTVAGQPIHPRRAVDIAVQVADALADAHAHGLTHGRLSPDTIVVTARGGHAKVLRIGLARWLDQTNKDSGDIDREVRADIAALGATLAEMLNGAPLPPGSETPIPSHIPPDLARIVGRALVSQSYDPARSAQGYAAAAAFAADLRAVAAQFEDRKDAASPARLRTSAPHSEPKRSWTWLIALVVVAVVVGLVWLALRAG